MKILITILIVVLVLSGAYWLIKISQQSSEQEANQPSIEPASEVSVDSDLSRKWSGPKGYGNVYVFESYNSDRSIAPFDNSDVPNLYPKTDARLIEVGIDGTERVLIEGLAKKLLDPKPEFAPKTNHYYYLDLLSFEGIPNGKIYLRPRLYWETEVYTPLAIFEYDIASGQLREIELPSNDIAQYYLISDDRIAMLAHVSETFYLEANLVTIARKQSIVPESLHVFDLKTGLYSSSVTLSSGQTFVRGGGDFGSDVVADVHWEGRNILRYGAYEWVSPIPYAYDVEAPRLLYIKELRFD
ncbi:MAG: hypothetical protein AAB534_02215 [Patescibacteria group bacterium]